MLRAGTDRRLPWPGRKSGLVPFVPQRAQPGHEFGDRASREARDPPVADARDAFPATRRWSTIRNSTPHRLPCTSSSGGYPRPPSPARWEGSASPEPSPCMGRTARHSRLAAGCGGFSASIPVHVAHAVHETAAEAWGLADARDTGPAVHRFGVPRVIAGLVGLSAVVARPTLGSVLLGHRRLVHLITFCFLNLASPRPRCGAKRPPPARLRRTWRSRSPRPSVRKHSPGDRDVTGTTRSPGE